MPASEAMSPEQIRDLYERRGKDFGTRAIDVSTRTVDDGLIPLTMSSEAPVLRYDWYTDTEYYEILDHAKVDLSYARDGLPFCVDHNTGEQIGLVLNVGVDKKSKMLDGDVKQGNNPDASWRFQDIRDRIRPKVSIGYIRGDYTVEKQNGSEPETRRYAFAPIECSTVPIPADYEVGFGRSLLRALRSANTPIPETTSPSGQEQPMAEKAIDTPPDAGTLEKERQANILTYCRANGVSAEKTLEFVSTETVTLGAVREFVRLDVAQKSNTETRAVSSVTPVVVARDGGDNGTKNGPFNRASEQWAAVLGASRGESDARAKLMQVRAATGSNESVQSDGGFLVQSDISDNLMQRVYNTGEVAKRCTRIPIGPNANGIVMNVIKETSRVDGSRLGGVRGYWLNEADTITSSKPEFRQLEQRLGKLGALVYTTDELLADSTALNGVIDNSVPKELQFKLEDAVWEGTGAGQPLGLTNGKSGGVISIAKESGQGAATIQTENLAKMWARKFGNEANFVWYVNQDTFPQLQTLQIGTGATATLVYMPAGGISGKPFGTIYGAPVVPIEYCSTLGTVGDIVLADMSQYLLIDKGGINSAESMHVQFLTDQMAYRFIYRVNGQPMWNAPLTPFKGTNTVSPFLTLATR